MLVAEATANLHSTMYLFQLIVLDWLAALNVFAFHYVSISTSLAASSLSPSSLFTFHYVSISTHKRCHKCVRILIYIPLCIYFNSERVTRVNVQPLFTFHYVSISTVTKRSAVPCIYLIYIPLCIYFNLQPGSFPRLLKYLHSTMYLFQLCSVE